MVMAAAEVKPDTTGADMKSMRNPAVMADGKVR